MVNWAENTIKRKGFFADFTRHVQIMQSWHLKNGGF